MIHAVRRASNAKNVNDITRLDIERLQDVSALLKGELLHKSAERNLDFSALATASPFDPAYTLGIDLRQFMKEVPEFERWNVAQKLGTEKKLLKLEQVLDNYAANFDANLLPDNPPQEELSVLEAILKALLGHTESALQS